MPQRRRRRTPPRMNMPQTMMKGMMDMSTMAVGGMIAAGTIGMVGSLLKK